MGKDKQIKEEWCLLPEEEQEESRMLSPEYVGCGKVRALPWAPSGITERATLGEESRQCYGSNVACPAQIHMLEAWS